MMDNQNSDSLTASLMNGLLSRAAVSLDSRIAEAAERGLGLMEYRVLLCLRDHDGVNQGVLAERVGTYKNALVTMIDRMEAKVLLKRMKNPLNRRENKIMLTEQGRKAALRFVAQATAALDQICQTLPADQQRLLVEWLRQTTESSSAHVQ